MGRRLVRAVEAMALCLAAHAAWGATIVECIDRRGVSVLTSSTSGAGCADPGPAPRRLQTAAVAGGTGAPTPTDFPRVGAAVQQSRDSDRAHILRDELASEEERLAALETQAASKPPAASDAPRLPLAGSRDVAASLARTRENIRALQRELAGVR